MHATSTPTLAQPKPGAYLALGLAAILAAAIGVGATVALNGRPVAAPTAGSQTGIEEALAAKNADAVFVPASSSVNGIESGVAAKNAGRVLWTSPTGTQVFTIGGRDPQATIHQAAGALSPYVGPAKVMDPTSPAVGTSAYDAFRAANGWDRPIVVIPSVVLSNDQIRAMVGRTPFPTAAQDPATNLSDYFGGRYGGNAGEGNTDLVGTSHR